MILDNYDSRIIDVLVMAKTFTNEASYGFTYSESNSLNYLWSVINDPGSALIVHYIDDKLAAAAIVQKDTSWHVEAFGYMSKFYVMPEFRKTTAARVVMKEVIDWFDAQHCVYSFATVTGNIGQDPFFKNLLRKFGYEQQGMVMVRKLNEQSIKNRVVCDGPVGSEPEGT